MEPITDERLAFQIRHYERIQPKLQLDLDTISALQELRQRRQENREFREKCLQIIASLPKVRVAAPERTEP